MPGFFSKYYELFDLSIDGSVGDRVGSLGGCVSLSVGGSVVQ